MPRAYLGTWFIAWKLQDLFCASNGGSWSLHVFALLAFSQNAVEYEVLQYITFEACFERSKSRVQLCQWNCRSTFFVMFTSSFRTSRTDRQVLQIVLRSAAFLPFLSNLVDTVETISDWNQVKWQKRVLTSQRTSCECKQILCICGVIAGHIIRSARSFSQFGLRMC